MEYHLQRDNLKFTSLIHLINIQFLCRNLLLFEELQEKFSCQWCSVMHTCRIDCNEGNFYRGLAVMSRDDVCHIGGKWK
jgi:hypothetical protein